MLLYISLFTIIIALLLVYNNNKRNKNTILLSFYFIIISIYGITHYLVVGGVSVFWIAIFYNNFSPVMLLLGPILYFYVRNSIHNKSKINRKELIHLLPAIINFIGVIPYYFTSFKYKEEIATKIINNINIIKDLKSNIFYPPSVGFISRPILLLIYSIASFIVLFKYSKEKRKKELMDSNMKWIIILLSTSFIISINYIIISLDGFLKNENFQFLKNENIFFISGFAFLIMALSLLLFPEILYGLPLDNIQKPFQKDLNILTNKTSKTIVKETINPEQFQESIEKIKNYIEQDMPYLDSDFSVRNISIKLEIPQPHVSTCIKIIWNKKFNKLKNELRVEHAKDLLTNGLKDNFTIDGIAQNSGFKTRSNFYSAFKSETGLTPTEFLDTQGELLH